MAVRPTSWRPKEATDDDLNPESGWRRRSWKFPAATLTTTTPIKEIINGSRNSAQETAA